MRAKIIYGLLSVFLVNIILWLTIGGKSIYQLPISQLSHHSLNSDTLFIEINPDNTAGIDYLVFDTASDELQEELIQTVLSEKVKSVVPKNRSELRANNCCGSPIFKFTIDRPYILLADVETVLLNDSESTIYDGVYVYFFGWRKFKITLTGMS